jgi:hypothetical protein
MQAELGKIGIHAVREALTQLKIYISYEQISSLCFLAQPEDLIGRDVWGKIVMENYEEILGFILRTWKKL